MNRATSHPADRKELQGAVHNETLLQVEESRERKLDQKNSGFGVTRSLSFRGQKGPLRQIPSVGLTR